MVSHCKSWLDLDVMVISPACIQKEYDSEPTWLEGSVSISRSPVAHPGDGRPIVLPAYDHDYRYVKFLPTVQRVRAIGKPPEGKLCLFSHLKNVVVLPSVGTSKFPVSIV
jgi:RNA-dependent RNA polymerase